MIILENKNHSLAKVTKNILQKHNIQLNKNLGQNYLIDDYKLKNILSFSNLKSDDTVLEIGSGIGTLTVELAKKVKNVISIEKDSKIYNILNERLEDENITNVELINDDALKTSFPKFNKIVSNLPYQISSPITFKFLDYDFDMAVLMYQKEFSNHMLAKPGSKDYSRLSAMLYFKADVELLDNVSSESFIPKPKVDSVVVGLKPKKKVLSDEEFEVYGRVCRALFQHKNKRSRNALIDSRHILGYKDKKVLKSELNNVDCDLFNERPVNMSPEDILDLTSRIKDIIL